MDTNSEKNERFTVTDEASAEWCMEKLAEKAAERQVVESQYEKMIARYEKWRTDSLEKLEADECYLQQLLRPWVENQLDGKKASSIKLPSGRIGFHAGPRQYTIGGEKASATNKVLLAFAKESKPDLVEVKETVKWAEMKKMLKPIDDGRVVTDDGEIVPDMTVEDGEKRFYCEVNK